MDTLGHLYTFLSRDSRLKQHNTLSLEQYGDLALKADPTPPWLRAAFLQAFRPPRTCCAESSLHAPFLRAVSTGTHGASSLWR